MAAVTPRSVGARVLRHEDPAFLTGAGRYVDDIQLAGLAHACFVRSNWAHAKLLSVDVGAARTLPGVHGILTAADIDHLTTPIRVRCSTPGYTECDTPILAAAKVRMVGEPIALVVAKSRYAAEDAAEAVIVDVEQLPALTTIEQALADDAAAIHDEAPDNLFNEFEVAAGAVDEAFAQADLTIELDVRSQRYGAVAIEGRAAIADFEAARGELTVWLTSQIPHLIRTGLSTFLGLPANRIRVISPDVGGGFGPKAVLYQEEVAIAAASRVLGRPIKWTSDRSEDLATTVHGREQLLRIRAAATTTGRVLGVDADIAASNGAYAPWPVTAGLDSGQASENVLGPYDVQNYRRKVRAVITNKAPMGPYRGVGRVIACLAIERVMDELALRLDLDPAEVRRRNLVRELPYVTAAGLRFESGDYPRLLDLLEKRLDYKQVRAENTAVRAEGRYRGVGLAFAVEHSSHGPQSMGSRNLETVIGGYDTASVRVEPDGRIRLAVGLHNHGQGHRTTMAQIAADELGVSPEAIEVVYGDTALVPYGMGTWASRSTVLSGGAAILAATDVRQEILTLAADMLEADLDDLEINDGIVSPRGVPGNQVTLAEVAHRAHHEPHLLPDGIEPGLEVTRRYLAPDPGSFSSAVHAAVVEVDPDTGQVEILRYVVAEDCGTIVNPMIVDGQVHGGVAQGVGGALYEHLVYDTDGQLLSGSLMDYLVPGSTEVPPIEIIHLESPSPHTLGGFKGMGEGGAINAPVAVVAAVNDALSPLGVVANQTPLSRVWMVTAIRAARVDTDSSR